MCHENKISPKHKLRKGGGGVYTMEISDAVKFPKSREDFDDFYILCEDVGSYDMAFKDCDFNETDLAQIEKKMYGDYEFYSDIDLALKGIEVINKNFDMRLMPA